MARLLFIASILGLITLPVYSYIKFAGSPSLPDLDNDAWWGPAELKDSQNTSIIPFEVSFDEDMINDLKTRLKRCQTTPLTPPLEDTNFTYGFNSDEMYSWCSYWADEYPFSERQEFLNQYPQYKVNIQGLWIHFISVKPEVPKGVEIVPLLLLHGWPSSVRMFYEAIPKLTAVSEDRNFAIHAIMPSLPGFGYSDAAVVPGLGGAEIAVLLNNFMNTLGYEQYYAQGGDWGAIIGSNLVTLRPENVLGYHSNMPWVATFTAILNEFIAAVYPTIVDQNLASNDSTLADRMSELLEEYKTTLEESGYLHLQATKPDTIGIALTESPGGLLAYILENMATWTNLENRQKVDGGLTEKFTKDQLIDNLMMYWAPRCITSSMRIYAESFNTKQLDLKIDEIPTPVPTWLSQAEHELISQHEYVYKFKYTNLVNFTVLGDVGHYVPFEAPEIFSEDVVSAIAAFRKLAEDTVKTEL